MKILNFCLIIYLLPFFQVALGQGSLVQKEKKAGYTGGFIDPAVQYQEGYTFLALGDFGRVGGYHQQDVARELGHAALSLDAAFIVSVGDNFYPNGVASTTDNHWQASYETIYKHPNLYTDWFVALGNHDYRGNVQAQIDYSKISRRWNMPATYYHKKVKLDDGKTLLFVVMDTNPFIDGYYEDPEKYPSLAEQDTTKQRRWLEEVLGDPDPSITCKIVVGHHPLYSGGKRKESADTRSFEAKFSSFFDKHGVHAYICGHEHDLQIIRPKGRFTTQFLSGAASEVRPTGTREGTMFSAAEPGFMAFTLVGNELLVQTIKVSTTGTQLLNSLKLNISKRK